MEVEGETRRERCKCKCKCKLELELQETESRSNPSVTLTRSLSFVCMQHSRPNGHIMRTRTGCHACAGEREREVENCA